MRAQRKKMSNAQMLLHWEKIKKETSKILDENPDFTGQITIEVHCKEGIIKDVYVTNRNKINGRN